MKKIIFRKIGEVETQTIYTGIDSVDGGWIATTCGDPITVEDDENGEIGDIIAGYADKCELRDEADVTPEDIDYVDGILECWGLK